MPFTDRQYEAETILQYNETDEDAYVWSASARFHRYMARLGVEPAKTAFREGTAPSVWYRVPKSWIRVLKPRQINISPERREQMRLEAKERFSRKPQPAQQNELLGEDELPDPETDS